MSMILQKFIADSGYASRRGAEELIRNKKVKVNGRIAELGTRVEGSEIIEVGKRRLRQTVKKIYIALNKPLGYVSTSRTFKDEKNAFDLLKNGGLPLKELKIAGRLDKNSRGLLILTNDGECVYQMTHPKFGHEKEYVVEVRSKRLGPRSEVNGILKSFISGIDIGEGDGAVKAKLIRYLGNYKFNVVLTGGKKRQIRRMFKALGYDVDDLQRVRIGEVKLGDLKEGQFRIIKI